MFLFFSIGRGDCKVPLVDLGRVGRSLIQYVFCVTSTNRPTLTRCCDPSSAVVPVPLYWRLTDVEEQSGDEMDHASVKRRLAGILDDERRRLDEQLRLQVYLSLSPPSLAMFIVFHFKMITSRCINQCCRYIPSPWRLFRIVWHVIKTWIVFIIAGLVAGVATPTSPFWSRLLSLLVERVHAWQLTFVYIFHLI